jgi:hypothetical protein
LGLPRLEAKKRALSGPMSSLTACEALSQVGYGSRDSM